MTAFIELALIVTVIASAGLGAFIVRRLVTRRAISRNPRFQAELRREERYGETWPGTRHEEHQEVRQEVRAARRRPHRGWRAVLALSLAVLAAYATHRYLQLPVKADEIVAALTALGTYRETRARRVVVRA